MTVCVSVKVAEGLVFAADSTVVLQNIQVRPDGSIVSEIVQSFNFANKVTRFKDYPISVMSWGLAAIGARTVQSLIMECEYEYKSVDENPTFTVLEVVTKLVAFIQERYDREYKQQPQSVPTQLPSLGIAVGGYSNNAFFADQFAYDFSISTTLESVRPDLSEGNPDFGANWWGLTDALSRLIRGFDGQAMQALIERGVSEEIIVKWINDGVGQLPLVFVGMPLQDAIDFAEYCVQVTIGRYRFSQGVSPVGGDVDIAVMRPKRFQWAKRKQWAIKD